MNKEIQDNETTGRYARLHYEVVGRALRAHELLPSPTVFAPHNSSHAPTLLVQANL